MKVTKDFEQTNLTGKVIRYKIDYGDCILYFEIIASIKMYSDTVLTLGYTCYKGTTDKYGNISKRGLFYLEHQRPNLNNLAEVKYEYMRLLNHIGRYKMDKRLKIYKKFDAYFPPMIDYFYKDKKTWNGLRYFVFNVMGA